MDQIIETPVHRFLSTTTPLSPFGYVPDRKITDVIKSGRFTFSAEIIPPRNGTQQMEIFSQIKSLIDAGAEFLSVTKGAGGSLRAGSLPIAQLIKDRFQTPCIAHFTCRDLTPPEVENQLVDHHLFGIRNILALRGDPPADQLDWVPKKDSYPYAYQLIEQIVRMNEGVFQQRPEDKGGTAKYVATDFCIGAAAYPEHANEKERLEFFRLKAKAGASYGITQMIFDVDAYSRFLDLCAKGGIHIPVLPGTRVLKSQKQARMMASRFGVSVPKEWIAALPEEFTYDDMTRVTDVFVKFTEKLRNVGAPGLHLFVLSDTAHADSVFRTLKSKPGWQNTV